MFAAPASADDEPRGETPAKLEPAAPPSAPGDLHDALAAQLAAEAASVDRALATVQGKLTAADAERTRRARSAARVLHRPPPEGAPLADHLAAARRAAAARLLLEHDASERGLLATEVERLHDAATRLAGEAARVAQIAAPTELAWPAHGTIARKFGPFEHEHSHAMLSRRGVDIEVDDHAQVVAPADGTVRYAGPIRGLDHGLVIDSGGYLVVLAKLAEPSLPVGAEVRRGDRVGRAARHRVYLEVRVALGAGGLPIDPETVLGKLDRDAKPKQHTDR